MKRKIDLIFRGLELGEGCIWDSKRNMVHFLDIHGFKIYSSILYASTLNNDSISCINTKNYVSAIVLDENNDLIACVKDKIFKYNLETGTRDLICKIPLPENFRFNDGKCDQYGNLWIGTMAIENPMSERGFEKGSFYCIKNGKVVAEYPKFTIPNGLAWIDKKLYHIDTATQKVFAYGIVDEYKLENKQTFVDVAQENASPDGMCMDDMGNLWVALWGGSKVVCYKAETGEKIDEVIMPEKNVSCCAFGGKDMNKLFVTTASDDKTGALYCVDMGEIKGRKSFVYKNIN